MDSCTKYYLNDLHSFSNWLDLTPERHTEVYAYLTMNKVTNKELAFVLGPEELRMDALKLLFQNAPGVLGAIVLAAARRALELEKMIEDQTKAEKREQARTKQTKVKRARTTKA